MSVIIQERRAQLLDGTIQLDVGKHSTFANGHCAMEVVAWLADEGHTDTPACASPVLRRYTIQLNDRWSHEQRQELVPYLPRMVGTAGDGQDEARLEIAHQALVTDLLPAWLRLAGMDAEADALASVPLSELRSHLYQLRDAAWARRSEALEPIRQAVREKLAGRPAAAVAAAVAAAAAVAVAVAAAVAADPWGPSYDAAYRAAMPIFEKAIAEGTAPKLVTIRDLAAAQRTVALDVLAKMIDPSAVAR